MNFGLDIELVVLIPLRSPAGIVNLIGEWNLKFVALKSKKKHALAYAVAGAAVLGSCATAEADFIGPYIHPNWTWTPAGDSSNLGTLTTFQLTGSNDLVTLNATALYTIAAAASGNVSFDWNYSSPDVNQYDFGGFYLNGVFTTLAFNSTQGIGTFSSPLIAGDTFGFFVTSADSEFGPGVLDISNFIGPMAVPEPGPLGLLAVGTLGGVLALRRRRNAQAI